MVDVTSFLTRWLYLCNLVRDRAEIQTLPYSPLAPPHLYQQQQQQQQQQLHSIPPPVNVNINPNIRHSNAPPPPLQQSQPSATSFSIAGEVYNSQTHQKQVEQEWKDQCFRGLLSYPPGTQRLMAMDALRVELVQKLAHQLKTSDDVMQRFTASCRGHNLNKKRAAGNNNDNDGHDNDDPFLDADVDIVRAFEQATTMTTEGNDDTQILNEQMIKEGERQQKDEESVLAISGDGSSMVRTNSNEIPSSSSSPSPQLPALEEEEPVLPLPTSHQVDEAHRLTVELRDYLPQLVSTVLHSPPSLTPIQGLDPVQKLRRLILTRCLQDANWGIELCWLLEAEVGRAWKTLFEHRQQTGKRLIVVLPAEKAAVLAKIGMEKRDAFNLLQDAEQATAYGYTLPSMEDPPIMGAATAAAESEEHLPPRLPSSLSMRRCSHFGDTMHFIDRLTQISLNLRTVPVGNRKSCLEQELNEMNRRLRRRMISRGDISIDMEDNRGPYDWPEVNDLTIDMLNFSVHFPLVPKSIIWPSGTYDKETGSAAEQSKHGVMRVLNIVSPECRLLASRERCPYMVHLEVVETGLDGYDARLFASGARDIGTTLEEAIGLATNTGSSTAAGSARNRNDNGGFPAYHIPDELLSKPAQLHEGQTHTEANAIDAEYSSALQRNNTDSESSPEDVPRGGWQTDDGTNFPPENVNQYYSNPYDMMRQHEYEQLHQQMQYQQQPPQVSQQVPSASPQLPVVTTKNTLLDQVFGVEWAEKCRQIQQASPYGNVEGWRLASFIMKAGEDIRREALVMQVIDKLNNWFKSDIPETHRPFMRPYTIMCVGGDAGLLECLTDAKSIDEIKKNTDGFTSLRDYFERAYGPASPMGPQQEQQQQQQQQQQHYHQQHHQQHHQQQQYQQPQQNPALPPSASDSMTFEKAQDNFLRSLVGSSLVCYILQIKDRHNANILMDREGHIVHIDFGFVLGDTPKMGKVPIFSERAPFKLSAEFWEVLGGWNFNEGGLGVKFCKMFEIAFACASAHSDELVSLVEAAVLNLTRNPEEARSLSNSVRSRLRMRGEADSAEQKMFIMDLVNTALTSWGTSTYDWLQKNMNGYQ